MTCQQNDSVKSIYGHRHRGNATFPVYLIVLSMAILISALWEVLGTPGNDGMTPLLALLGHCCDPKRLQRTFNLYLQ